MGIIVGFVVVLFIPVCFLLPVTILLQDSKGGGLASSAFGGAGMQSVLGGRGASTFLSKVTTGLAISYMVISLLLMRFYGNVNRELKPLQPEAAQTQEAFIAPAPEVQESAAEAAADTPDSEQ